MLTIGPLAFLSPFMLLPLLALPVLWWLLRLTPPAPKRINFPAIRLLMGLKNAEETPAHTPWWILLLRLVITALIITALAEPVLHPNIEMNNRGPLLLVMDDGWASGPLFPAYQQQAAQLLDQAGRTDRPVRLLFTAPPEPKLSDVMRASEAKSVIANHTPKPWPIDRLAARKALEGAAKADVHYYSDGVDSLGATELMKALASLGPTQLSLPEAGRLPMLLFPPEATSSNFEIMLRRAGALPESQASLRATANDGRLLAHEIIPLPAGKNDVSAKLQLPTALRNEITRIEIENENQPGAVLLLDEHWRRRPLGIIAGSGNDQPLLGESYFLERALKPYAELRRGTIDTLLEQGISLLILADVTALTTEQQSKLSAWMEKGGVLLRFAGPNLANHPDALLPVKLRTGERELGGALSWEKPQPLKSFVPETPLAGLHVPEDVTITKQVLAEPSPDLASKTWATLGDGTPLVTGEMRGKGWLILVHTTANADWSTLSLSGTYVEILRRCLALSTGLSAEIASGALLPSLTLSGYGQLVPAPATAQAIEAEAISKQAIDAAHPPGFYGNSGMQAALNLAPQISRVISLPAPPSGVVVSGKNELMNEKLLLPYLITAALLLFALDMLIALRLRGLLALLLLLPFSAQASEETATYAAGTWLAYVQTGDADTDGLSESGLAGLSTVLRNRTSVEPDGVAGVDLEQDDISTFPLLYWPITSSQSPLSDAARAKVNTYLQHGGLIVFDTQDGSDGQTANADLMRLAQGLDIPPLAPIKPDHVLTRSFYLLDAFPGLETSGTIWLDASAERRHDNVSGVIVTGNNWAGAWASSLMGSSRNSMQIEHARRVGVNLVMYALTGNYKSDQMHVRALLEKMNE